MKLAIVGSRSCPQIDISAHFPFVPDTIVSGGAAGADTIAKEYALVNGIPLLEFLPEYGKYGKRAPLLRNIKIVDNCDYLIAFWDGRSRGTKFTIDYAQKRGIPTRIIKLSS